MKKQNFLIYLFMGIFLIFASNCKKDDEKDKIPLLSTAEVTKVGQITALCGGNISSDAGFTITSRGVCWNTKGNPTISDNKTTDGLGAGSYKSELTGLTLGTTYFVRAYATNNQGTAYGSTMVFGTLGSTFTDSRDGNVYKILTIGDQLWMVENLRYLPDVVLSGTGSQTHPYYYVYGYNNTIVAQAKATANYTTYGVLYNWRAAMAGSASSSTNPSGIQGVCPAGWHLPGDLEWTQLTDFLGGASIAGGKLKETGIIHWNSPNTGATNETGFTALPGGNRSINGLFNYIGVAGYFWSATDYDSDNAWRRDIGNNSISIARTYGYFSKESAFSVRCIKD
jgi:uncharacterized protein (TIGR02145 family)